MASFLIACGGTGGHLSPGIGLAERLSDRGHSCALIVSGKDIDARLSSKHPGLLFLKSPGGAFSFKPTRWPAFAVGQLRALFFAFRLMRKMKPSVAIAFGGFTTTGIALAAIFSGRPLALHEANRRPGKAVRMFGRFADRVYLPQGVQLKGAHPQTIRRMGMPLRKSIRALSKEKARARLGLKAQGKLITVLGGSQGAQALNQWARDHAELLCATGLNLYCVTGPGKGVEGVYEFNVQHAGVARAWFTSFCDDMAALISASDLVISRAGAGTLAELVECAVPSILIPYPHAADDHQQANARFLERQGGCVLIDERMLGNLYNEVTELAFNDWLLEKLQENLQRAHRGDAAAAMANDLERLEIISREASLNVELPA